jgi:stage V sporulation protein AE
MNTEMLLDYVKAFAVGGALCVIAQILIDRTALTPARILVGYVVSGVILGALGIYEPLMDFAGAGASTPLTGFGYVIAKGVREAVDKDGAFGILRGALTASSAVVTAVLVMSFIAAIFTKRRPK